MKNIILAFDSFKGSVSSATIMKCAAKAIKDELPRCVVTSFPIADGGEGTVEAIANSMEIEWVKVEIHNPLMDPIQASYGIVKESQTAIIEMAAASGLPLISKDKQNPRYTTTYGTGELIKDALGRGCRNIVLGIGGSATNDAGIGVMSALGIRFLNSDGKELAPIGNNLDKIASIDTSDIDKHLSSTKFIIACDVNNPFYGENGAAYVYAPQKGASEEDVKILDSGLRHYATVLEKKFGVDISTIHGAGAAGGMGGGLLPFLTAELKPGIDTILEIIHFDDIVRCADLIFTGEGKIDSQTGMGKALGGIMKIANKYDVPVIALGGAIDDVSDLNKMGFTGIFSIQPGPVDLEKAMDQEFTLNNIGRVITQIIRIIKRLRK